MTPDDLRRRLLADPSTTALLFDFDGTLAAIVEDPFAAAPVEGMVELIHGLAARFDRVAVVSGRSRSFLAQHFAPEVELSGLYGLELRTGVEETDHPEAGSWRPAITHAAASAARALPETVTVEPKGLSLTVHYRREPSDEDSVREWAERAAHENGLELREAKASVELHPPVRVDKGTSVVALTAGCETVVYVGDDVGDLPAFAALDDLRLEGVDTIKVATGSLELPDEVADAADLVVDGPAGVIELLRPLITL